MITLSLPIVVQQTPPAPEQPSGHRETARLGRWVMASGAAAVAASLVTGTVVVAVGGLLLIAAGKYVADV